MWKKIGHSILIILPFALMILLFSQKDKLTSYLSDEMKSQTTPSAQKETRSHLDSLYNYEKNHQMYEITFLEFGAKNCVACKKMEFVLDEVRKEYPGKVNVVFLNILQNQNQQFMRYYGVVAIPTQIQLNKNGKEFYRHTGYISFTELREKLGPFSK